MIEPTPIQRAVRERMLAVASGAEHYGIKVHAIDDNFYGFAVNRPGAVPGMEERDPAFRAAIAPDGSFDAEFMNFPPKDSRRILNAVGFPDPVERAAWVVSEALVWLRSVQIPPRFAFKSWRSFDSYIAERGDDGIYRERVATPEDLAELAGAR